MNTHGPNTFLIVFLIVFISGLMGGIINYMMFNFSKKWNKFTFLRDLFYGVFSAAVILFILEIVMNNVVKDFQESGLIYLVFGCFCFVSTIFLSLILRGISAKLQKKSGEQASD